MVLYKTRLQINIERSHILSSIFLALFIVAIIVDYLGIFQIFWSKHYNKLTTSNESIQKMLWEYDLDTQKAQQIFTFSQNENSSEKIEEKFGVLINKENFISDVNYIVKILDSQTKGKEQQNYLNSLNKVLMQQSCYNILEVKANESINKAINLLQQTLKQKNLQIQFYCQQPNDIQEIINKIKKEQNLFKNYYVRFRQFKMNFPKEFEENFMSQINFQQKFYNASNLYQETFKDLFQSTIILNFIEVKNIDTQYYMNINLMQVQNKTSNFEKTIQNYELQNKSLHKTIKDYFILYCNLIKNIFILIQQQAPSFFITFKNIQFSNFDIKYPILINNSKQNKVKQFDNIAILSIFIYFGDIILYCIFKQYILQEIQINQFFQFSRKSLTRNLKQQKINIYQQLYLYIQDMQQNFKTDKLELRSFIQNVPLLFKRLFELILLLSHLKLNNLAFIPQKTLANLYNILSN